jgi:hypothetical protein
MRTSIAGGRSGSLLDTAVGGDVDSDPDRPLSIGQLQSALRLAQAPCDHKSGGEDHQQDGENERSQVNNEKRRGRARPRSLRQWVLSSRLVDRKVSESLGNSRRRQGTADAAKAIGVWHFPQLHRGGSFYVLARRWVVLALAAMLLVVGGVTVAGRVVSMVDPAPVVFAAAPRVSDLQFAGAAQAAVLDYLSWDATAPRSARAPALSRWGVSGALTDGWDGSGRLYAENAVPIAVLRLSDESAVVTVQARKTTSTPHPTATPVPVGAAQPADSPSWIAVAVPVAVRGSRVMLTAPPALVGAPPVQALGAAVRTAADEDTEASRVTAATVHKLISAYGSGDLEFVRGPGSTFMGLAGMVTGGQVLSWRMAKAAAGSDPSLRAGDVTVLWELPDGAGQLRCSYRVLLVQLENRWLLQQITPAVSTS